jgi:hypothetical protein
MSRETDDTIAETPERELVHWMAPKPLGMVTPAGSSLVIGAFLLGIVAAVGVLAASGRLSEEKLNWRALPKLPRVWRR